MPQEEQLGQRPFSATIKRHATLDQPLPTRIAASAIPPGRVSANAVAIVRKLREAGFDAYLVGGCVRDLLLGRTPKDFDVATAARPDAICALFPRSRVVGRRFRIVHVRMRREVIEVSTFRRALAEDDESVLDSTPNMAESVHAPSAQAHFSERGMIVRDNAYGTMDEDAFRRDFTVNALYYDPAADAIFDYCGGMADVASRTLRLIGDPAKRFREDPVRMLRAIRFAAKLGMRIHQTAVRAMEPDRALLCAVPGARLFDEFGKLFLSGYGARTLELLEHHGIMRILFPLPHPPGDMFQRAIANTDQRVAEDKPVTPGFLLAALLWRDYAEQAKLVSALPRGERDQASDDAARGAFARLRETISPPRRHACFAQDIWQLQPRLERRTATDVTVALGHRRFRAAYDFLLLRAEAGEVPAELAQWWAEAQTADPEDLRQSLPAAPKTRRRRTRRRGRRRNAASAHANPLRTANGAAERAAPPTA